MQLNPWNELFLARSHNYLMPGHSSVSRLVHFRVGYTSALNFTDCTHVFLPSTELHHRSSWSAFLPVSCYPQHLVYRPHWTQLISASQELLCLIWSLDLRNDAFLISSPELRVRTQQILTAQLGYVVILILRCSLLVGLSLPRYNSCCF